MAFHWNDLPGLQATGGAVLRKYDRLVEQAHGATAGSPAHLARLAFENAWLADPAAVLAECEAEEGLTPRRRRKPRLVEPEPEPETEDEEQADGRQDQDR